jgi:hypothetical protein
MKAFLAIALATTALMAAAPVFAQNQISGEDAMRGLRAMLGNQPGDPSERDLVDQERHLTDVLEQSMNEHLIDRRQADHVSDELRAIHNQKGDLRAKHGGQFTPADHDYIRGLLANLDGEIDRMRDAGLRARGNQRTDNPPPPPPQDQSRDHDDHGRGRGDFWERAPKSLDEREDWLEQQIRAGMADRSLDRGEAGHAIEQLRSIRRKEASYMRRDRGELSDAHREALTDRLNDLGQQLHWDRTN